MQRQRRLSRLEVIARIREHGARYGSVSRTSLGKHDRIVLRSLHLYFPNVEAARRAARVAATPRAGARRRPGRRTAWSKRRAIDELRRLDRSGRSTAWADLMRTGHRDLVAAAVTHAGGLRQARADAGLSEPARRPQVRRWNKARIVEVIEARRRKGQTLASSKAPQRFVAAARWHFGSWDAALAAAGVDARDVRLHHRPYSKPEIIELMRRLAREGTAIRASTLKRVIKVDTVRKLFGSIEAAVRAAGLAHGLHPNQRWSRERVIAELRARARRGKLTLTRALQRPVQLYFGSVHAARKAAGLPSLRREPWSEQSLIDELRRRARRGDSGSTLWSACKRLFGSLAAARRAAGVPATQRTKGMAAWSKPKLVTELRRRVRQRRQLSRGLTEGLRRAFGSLAAARAYAGLPDHRRARPRTGRAARPVLADRTAGWTADRIRRALRKPTFDVTDPAFVAACIHHFGSVTAARTSASRSPPRRSWTKQALIAELHARGRRGLRGVGRLLHEPAVRLFGSTDAALRAAREPR